VHLTIAGESAGDELDFHRNFERLQVLSTKPFNRSAGFSLIGGSAQLDVGADDLSGDGIRLAIYNGLSHELTFEQDGFDFNGENLLPTNIDQFGVPAEKAHVISIDLNAIAGDEIAVLGERTGTV